MYGNNVEIAKSAKGEGRKGDGKNFLVRWSERSLHKKLYYFEKGKDEKWSVLLVA